ncbi:unnamed protein product [Meloidogyne enterolobii]|uniref:Uncharacterized protein n=1 Tax=Meloidogyne enterolobii TaxID=390850 RepID=A0ACB0ZHH1_MELEN
MFYKLVFILFLQLQTFVKLVFEVEELRQMLFQMQNESSAFSPTSAASRFRQQHPQHIQKPQSPPSPPHPSIPQPVLQQTFQSTTNQQLRQALLLQNQAAINNSNSQGQAQQQFQHSGNANNYNSHVLQLFLSQASANQQHHSQHSQNLSHPPMSSASSSSTSATNPATAPGVNRILEQIGQQLDIATLQGNGSNPSNAQQSTEKQQQQLLVSTIQMLQQAAQIQQINGQASQQQGSGASTRNNSIQSGESVFYDPSNMDVSETSSSSSSTNAQVMLQTSPQLLLDSKPAALLQQLQHQQQQIVNVNQIQQQQQQHQQNQQQQNLLNPNNRNNQLDLISAAISRTNAAVTSHLLSPAHGGETNVIQQQQQQCNTTLSNTPMAAKLATLQTLLVSLQQQQQQQQQLALHQRIQQQQHQTAVISNAKNQQHHFAAPNKFVLQQSPTRDNIPLSVSAVAAHQQQQQHFTPRNQHLLHQHHHSAPAVPVPSTFTRNLPQHQHPHQTPQQRHHDTNHHQLLQHHHSAQHERVVVVERRRAASDDYIQSICSQKYTEEYIQQIQIPVPEAHACDPNFRPLTEQQVIQQVLQNKKYENQSVAETMAQLCKKLAEKRVFGSRLMSKTTVAAPNHSSYSNLPLPGIIYIYYVCQKVLFKRVEKEEEFKECFRDAMRKLAARCRRVRHARKNHNSRHGIAVNSGGLDNPSLMLGSQPTSAFTQFNSGMSRNNSHGTEDSICNAETINALVELANRQQQFHQHQQQKFSLNSALGNFENTLTATELASRISDVATGNGCNHSPLGATLENTVCITSQPSNVEKMEISEDNGLLKEEINERELMDEELLDEDLGCCPLSSPTISSQSTGEASITHQQSPGDADRDSIDTNDQQSEISKPTTIVNIKQQLSPINNQKNTSNNSLLSSQPMDASSSSPCF